MFGFDTSNLTAGGKQMKVAFTGYYGFDNYGDDLFSVVCWLAAQRYWPKVQVSIIVPPGPHLRGISAKVPGVLPKECYNRTDVLGLACRISSMVRAVIRSDMIIFGGGSVFSTGSLTTIRRLQEWASRHQLARFAAIGVSFGPFLSRDDEKRCQDFLRNFEYVSVRDQASYEALKSISLPFEPVLARDLAGMLPALLGKQPIISSQKLILGVAPCNNSGGNGWQRDVLFEAVINFAKRTDATVRSFILNGHPVFGDEALASDLAERLVKNDISVEIVRLNDGALNVWERIAECNLMLSVRLHGAISAYLCRIPFALVEYHEKCAEFAKDVGQRDQLRLQYGNSGYEEVLNCLDALYKGSSSWDVSPERYVEEALLNFTAAPWARSPS